MAKQTVIHMTDDLDGTEATQAVDFSYRGKTYSIDLNDSNASDLDDALAPYIAAVERTGAGHSSSRSSGRRAAAPRQRSSGDVDPPPVLQ